MWQNSFALFLPPNYYYYYCYLSLPPPPFFGGLPGVLSSLPPARPYQCACFVSCLRYKVHFASPCLGIIFHFVRTSPRCFFLGRSVAFAFQIPTSCMIQFFHSLSLTYFSFLATYSSNCLYHVISIPELIIHELKRFKLMCVYLLFIFG